MATSRRKSNVGIAVLLLGGKGLRYGSDTPKQYVEMGGKPLFLHAYETLISSSDIDSIILVVPKGYRRKTLSLIKNKEKLIALVEGGETREESAYKALTYLGNHKADPYSLVYIHDGDRPLLTHNLIKRLKEGTKKNMAAIPALPISDSMAYSKEGITIDHYGDRRGNYTIQTPQVAALSILLTAFKSRKNELANFTDEGSLLISSLGIKPTIIMGEPTNIKINDRGGQLLFETLLRGKNNEVK